MPALHFLRGAVTAVSLKGLALRLGLALATVATARVAVAAQTAPVAPTAQPVAAPTLVPQQTAPPAADRTSESPAPATGRRLKAFSLDADRVAFYSNRYLVEADGHVNVVLGDGTRITGNTFSMDLRLDRFLLAGDVTVTADGKVTRGAAFAQYFNVDRAYFVPITSEPDRWTFAAGDYEHPLLGRQMPGDAFFLPDLDGERVFVRGDHAVIDPGQSLRFVPAQLNFGPNVFVPFPEYFLNFSPNPNFEQNSLVGAYIDGPYDIAGGENGTITLHARYDSLNKVYGALEAHLVGDHDYLVGSINPATRPQKEYNLLGLDRVSPNLEVQVFAQENAFQHDFGTPLSATAFVQTKITAALPHSYVQLTTANYYDSLLAQPKPGIGGLLYYGDPSHNFLPDHPFQFQLSWIGNRQEIRHVPLTTQVRSSFSYAHSNFEALQSLGGVNYFDEYIKAFGVNVATKSLIVTRNRINIPDLYFTASFDKQRQFFSLPHFIDTQSEIISLTKIFVPNKVTTLVSYSNQNTGDFYGRQQNLAYPPESPGSQYLDPFTGQPVPGYGSFRGFGTTRSFSEQFVWTPSAAFALNAGMRENDDFPVPVAGMPQFFGATTSFLNYGVPPKELDLDVRYRLTPTLVLDVARSNYFGFGGYERWSPRFYVQFVR